MQTRNSTKNVQKKIAVIIDAFTPGGAQRNLQLIIPVWIKKEYEVTLVLLQRSQNELNFSQLISSGMKLERINASKMLDFKALIHFLRLMRSFRHQQVIANLFWSQIWGVIAKLIFPSINLTWVEHNTYLKRNYVQWVFFRLGSFMTDKVFVVSVEIIEFLASKGIKRTTLINNAVQAQGSIQRVRAQPKTVLFVGRLNEQKNPMFALRVYLQIVKSNKEEFRTRLKILGEGPLLEEMKDFTTKNRFEKMVDFLGFLEPAQVSKEMSLASVLLMTSLHEGSPLVRLEALENGMCIVTTQTSGLKALLVDAITGEVNAPGIFIGESETDLAKYTIEAFKEIYWTQAAFEARRNLVAKMHPEEIALKYLQQD